jgi:hypothetical protein
MSTPRRWRAQSAHIWDRTPHSPRTIHYERIVPLSRERLHVTILNEQLEETWTHFIDGRTVFCTGTIDPVTGQVRDCWLAHQETGRERYGGWLAVLLRGSYKPHLLRLTSVAVSVEARLRQSRGLLRGRHLEVWRLYDSKGAPMHCRLLDQVTDPAELVPPPDVRYQVAHMIAAEDRPKVAQAGNWKGGQAALAAIQAREAKAAGEGT